MTMRTLANEKGVFLIMAVATLMLFFFMALVMVSVVGKESYSVVHQAQSLQAFGLAEAGIHRALTFLSREGGRCAEITGIFTSVTLGPGTFTVTATPYTPLPTTLSADINSTDTTISVADTTGFAPRGRINIESEFIDYTGTTGTSFTGARRGADGTTNADHTSGTSVSQYKCTVVSTGTIPGPAGDSKRVIEATVQ